MYRTAVTSGSDSARVEKLDGVAAFLTASQQVSPRIGEITTHRTLFNPTDAAPAAWIDRFIRSNSEAEVILQFYRTDMEPLFPFVVTPSSMTFTDLRKQKPFVVLAILMVGCSHDQERQTAIAKKIREIMSYNLLIEGERSLDVLQSLLIYVNWSEHPSRFG